MNFKTRIAQTIAQKGIFEQQDTILVALSGGADSVALLCVLNDLGYQLQALHCNFHLRGEESKRDEQFVSQLCEKLDIPLHIKHFDTQGYADQLKISIEMAARDLRYNWFNEQLQVLKAEHIAVAHHRDDQAETLLLHIIRGSGLRGLTGMQYVNGAICRPLLDVSRNDILNYLQHNGQDYVTDSTNLEREAVRNRIRLDILPALAKLNPNINETLCHLAQNVQDAMPIYESGLKHMHDMHPEEAYQHSPFTVSEATLTLLHEWTSPCGFTRTQLQNILQAETGRMVESSTHRLLRDREHFILNNKSAETKAIELDIHTLPTTQIGTMKKGNAYLDAQLVHLPLRQRQVQPSDRFTPLGMKGSKLISDYLTDLKLNRFQKEAQEVLTDADDRILWVIGYATDHHFRITSSTTEALYITIKA